jgi:antitoxin component of RelBE/YafQ-DinJ toxin-antitoxin module
MTTIEVSIDESLLAEVEQAAHALQMTPMDFMNVAIERAVVQRERIALERQHAQDEMRGE